MSAPSVFAYDEQQDVALDLTRWTTLARDVLISEGVAAGELTLSFVSSADIAELHEEHMGEAGPTDVLSFPLDAELVLGEVANAGVDDAPVLLGDVVVCPAIARINAPEHAGSLDDELALLIVHGVLHVLGHDHSGSDDTVSMRARERALLEAHHWHHAAPDTFAAHRSAP